MSTGWLITGGAGYIGAHVVRAMTQAGHRVVVLDDLSTGLHRKVPNTVELIASSVLDTAAVHNALIEHQITGVMHIAAKKSVEESVRLPELYHEQNVIGMESLLTAISDTGVRRFVLSSSAAVYGAPESGTVDEGSATEPINPYGATKMQQEVLLRDHADDLGLSWLALRYFNVAGAGADDLGDTGIHNLIPLVLRALERHEHPQVFGDDYPTADGTCVRDYIHVQDLAQAHVVAAERTSEAGHREVYNVGRGEGFSVLEVLQAVRRVTGVAFDHDVAPRRPGDPPTLIATTDRITEELGWRATRDLDDIVASAWAAWRAFPPSLD
jgi:UDP-glucose 4-epimerase